MLTPLLELDLLYLLDFALLAMRKSRNRIPQKSCSRMDKFCVFPIADPSLCRGIEYEAASCDPGMTIRLRVDFLLVAAKSPIHVLLGYSLSSSIPGKVTIDAFRGMLPHKRRHAILGCGLLVVERNVGVRCFLRTCRHQVLSRCGSYFFRLKESRGSEKVSHTHVCCHKLVNVLFVALKQDCSGLQNDIKFGVKEMW